MYKFKTNNPKLLLFMQVFPEADFFSGEEWEQVVCPFHGEVNASAGVNTYELYFNCFVCGGLSFKDFKNLCLTQLGIVPSIEGLDLTLNFNKEESVIEHKLLVETEESKLIKEKEEQDRMREMTTNFYKQMSKGKTPKQIYEMKKWNGKVVSDEVWETHQRVEADVKRLHNKYTPKQLFEIKYLPYGSELLDTDWEKHLIWIKENNGILGAKWEKHLNELKTSFLTIKEQGWEKGVING